MLLYRNIQKTERQLNKPFIGCQRPAPAMLTSERPLISLTLSSLSASVPTLSSNISPSARAWIVSVTPFSTWNQAPFVWHWQLTRLLRVIWKQAVSHRKLACNFAQGGGNLMEQPSVCSSILADRPVLTMNDHSRVTMIGQNPLKVPRRGKGPQLTVVHWALTSHKQIHKWNFY